MGSPLTPIIADIILQDLESRMIETLPFYVRYVNDVALSVPSSMLEFTLKAFNSLSVHPKLQFTLEVGIDNRIFLMLLSLLETILSSLIGYMA